MAERGGRPHRPLGWLFSQGRSLKHQVFMGDLLIQGLILNRL